jgi:hypothetical protein
VTRSGKLHYPGVSVGSEYKSCCPYSKPVPFEEINIDAIYYRGKIYKRPKGLNGHLSTIIKDPLFDY